MNGMYERIFSVKLQVGVSQFHYELTQQVIFRDFKQKEDFKWVLLQNAASSI